MLESNHYVASLLSVFAAEPERVVLWWRDRPITAAEFRLSITAAARVLRSRGITQDRTVGVLVTGNSPQLLVARYAANLLGATVLHAQSVNAADSLDMMSVDTQADILAESRVSLLFVDSENVDRAGKIRAHMADPPALVTFDGDSLNLVPPSTNETQASEEISAVSGRIATVMYTSGSTGRPKGVAYSFATVNTAYLVRTSMGANRPRGGDDAPVKVNDQVQALLKTWSAEKPVRLVTTSLRQTIAFTVDVTLGLGGVVVLRDGFEAADVLATVSKYRVTHLYVTPPQLYQLVDHPTRVGSDLSSLRLVGYAGCTATPAKIARAAEAFGPILSQVYGLTEAAGISSLLGADHLDPKLLGTVGRPFPLVEIAIRDPQTGEDLPVGKSGEICVRTPFMMEGYWCDAELTAQKLRGGWLHTGDVGFVDDGGYLHLIDRLAGMIKTNGIKVYPSTVESALLGHPAVAQAAVYGVTDAENVEHVQAAVVLSRGAAIDPAELRDHVQSALSHVNVPIGITLLDELPLSATGKPDKRRLRFEFETAAGWR